MDYQICFESFRKNFALPDLLSIQQLKQVDGRYLKVLLLLFQNPDRHYTSDLLSSLLELPESVVEDALAYWAQHGAVTLKDQPAPPRPAPVLSGGEVRPRVPADDEELRFLLSSMESILNRPVNSTDIQEVIQIYESYRLPADVIIMAMQFCSGQGHNDIRYIKKVCYHWYQRGINDHHKADEYLQQLAKRMSLEGQIKALFGVNQRQLIPNEQECLDRWLDLGYDLDVFRLAYERTVKHTGKAAIPYANRILQNWKQKGYRNLQDIQAGEPERGSSNVQKGQTSYDLDSLDRFWDEVPDYPTKGGSDQ